MNDGTKAGVEKEMKFRLSILGILYTIFIEPFKMWRIKRAVKKVQKETRHYGLHYMGDGQQ